MAHPHLSGLRIYAEPIDIRELYRANQARLRRRNLARSSALVAFGLALSTIAIWWVYA